MAKSKVEKTLRDSLSTINDLRREVKKVRKAGEKALAQQFEKATSSSAAEIKKLRDELDRVRETTAKQIADLTAVVARLAPDLMKSSQASPGPAAEPAPRPTGPDGPVGEPGSDRPHGDPLGAAAAETTPAPVKKAAKKAPAKKATAKKAPAKKATAKKAPAKKATSTPQDTTDQRLTLKGEALAASEGVSAIDEDAPGTAPTSAVTVPGDATGASRPAGAPAKKAPAKKAPASKAAAKKTPAKKTTAKKAPAKKAGATSTAKRTSAPGQKTTARKATAKKAPSTSTPPAATPDNAAVADRPAAD